MTSIEYNYLMIFMIIVALALIGYLGYKYLKRWILWLTPLLALLLLGLLYSIIYLIDASNGSVSNPILFNTYNQILRGGSYLVIIAYLVAFIILQRKVMGKIHG